MGEPRLAPTGMMNCFLREYKAELRLQEFLVGPPALARNDKVVQTLLANNLYDEFALAGFVVEIDEDDLLPGAEGEAAGHEGDG